MIWQYDVHRARTQNRDACVASDVGSGDNDVGLCAAKERGTEGLDAVDAGSRPSELKVKVLMIRTSLIERKVRGGLTGRS